MTKLQTDIVNYRAKENVTQAELASKVGITREYLCNIETGTVTPSVVTEAKIRLVIDEKEV